MMFTQCEKKILARVLTGRINNEFSSQYICDNIQTLCRRGLAPSLVAHSTQLKITSMIPDQYGVGEWLAVNVPAAQQLFLRSPRQWREQLELYRLRWLTHLIAD